jgi:hypothetical protein
MESTEWSVHYCCLRLPRIQPDLNSISSNLEQRSAAEVYFCLQRELHLPFFHHPESHEPGHHAQEIPTKFLAHFGDY